MDVKHIEAATGHNGLPLVKVRTPWSTAEIYLHGAHITRFQKIGEPPLLWMSGKSLFTPDKAIRGGVPICFPWFGPREGQLVHGYARIADWELIATEAATDGSVTLRFHLPKNICAANSLTANVEFVVMVGATLTMELKVTNMGGAELSLEDCLHTYFTVGDIGEVSITGLRGTEFLDKVDGAKRKRETDESIRIASEVDRVYLDTTGAVEIHDAKLRRIIRVEKSGSRSTVVWNPWVAKSKAMPDFGDEEFHGMVCVESGNVTENKLTLAPGATTALKVTLSSRAG